MNIAIFPDAAQAAAAVAEEILSTIAARPASVLGLATGGTMEALYELWGDAAEKRGLSMAELTTFNLDEYWPLEADSPHSYRQYMQKHLLSRCDFTSSKVHLPACDAPDPSAEAHDYERRIGEAGGIDLQLLGVGRTGHIGFNEPGSSLASRTRLVSLAAQTRQDNSRFFAHADEVPELAITMGVATIMAAKRIILLALGSGKADVVAAAIEGPIMSFVPASVLQVHPNVTLVLDEPAAANLRYRDDYRRAGEHRRRQTGRSL